MTNTKARSETRAMAYPVKPQYKLYNSIDWTVIGSMMMGKSGVWLYRIHPSPKECGGRDAERENILWLKLIQ